MLNQIKDNPGASKKRKCVGRGIGSGKGKTCGRGGKGQTARSGVAIGDFEGGQMPLFMRLPKRGFNNFTRREYYAVNFSDLEHLIEDKKIDPKHIKFTDLVNLGVVKGKRTKIKVLGTGELKTKFKIETHAVSGKARAAIEKVGGEIVIIERPKTILVKKPRV
jgi:large subunit ribosomal protein L15